MANKARISARALIQRINRRLTQDYVVLKIARQRSPDPSVLGHGRYYILDLNDNVITRNDVDLDALGRELGVLKPWEEVYEEQS
jgi:hypothetical protein